MKEITQNDITIKTFEPISSYLSPRQLFRLNDKQFALALLERGTELFRFESSIFSDVINDLDTESISDVTLIRWTEPERREDGPEGGFELRLFINNGDVIIVNSKDRVRLCLRTTYGYTNCESDVRSIRGLYDLPNEYPFEHLQISVQLAEELSDVIEKFGASEVIRRIWLEYQNLTRNSLVRPTIPCSTRIQTEFCNLKIIEHPCGKTTLLAIDS